MELDTALLELLTMVAPSALAAIPVKTAVFHFPRKGIVLTCKERLIGFYAQFGFVDEGVSVSTHGDVVWHQMRLTF